MSWRKKIKDQVYRSPTIKTGISLGTSVLGGLFANTLVADMTGPKGIEWATFYLSLSFWLLLLVCFITFVFHKFLHEYETEINSFKDADFCMAYARSQLIPAQVEVSIQAIARGDVDQFKAAMKQIKDALK